MYCRRNLPSNILSEYSSRHYLAESNDRQRRNRCHGINSFDKMQHVNDVIGTSYRRLERNDKWHLSINLTQPINLDKVLNSPGLSMTWYWYFCHDGTFYHDDSPASFVSEATASKCHKEMKHIDLPLYKSISRKENISHSSNLSKQLSMDAVEIWWLSYNPVRVSIVWKHECPTQSSPSSKNLI